MVLVSTATDQQIQCQYSVNTKGLQINIRLEFVILSPICHFPLTRVQFDPEVFTRNHALLEVGSKWGLPRQGGNHEPGTGHLCRRFRC